MALPSKRVMAIMSPAEKQAAIDKHKKSQAKKKKGNPSGININPKHKGLFTAKAKKAGMGVQEFASHVLANKDQYDKATVEQANFAHNAPKFNH